MTNFKSLIGLTISSVYENEHYSLLTMSNGKKYIIDPDVDQVRLREINQEEFDLLVEACK